MQYRSSAQLRQSVVVAQARVAALEAQRQDDLRTMQVCTCGRAMA